MEEIRKRYPEIDERYPESDTEIDQEARFRSEHGQHILAQLGVFILMCFSICFLKKSKFVYYTVPWILCLDKIFEFPLYTEAYPIYYAILVITFSQSMIY